NGFPIEIEGPKWSDDNGWAAPQFFTTIQFADIDGNGKADLCARAAAGVICELSDGNAFSTEVTGPAWTSAGGWDAAQYDATIGFADIDGDGLDDVCGRAAAGLVCARSQGTSFADAAPGPVWSDDEGWSKEEYYSSIRYSGANVEAHNGGVPPTGSGANGVNVSADGSAVADAGCACRATRNRPASPLGELVLAAMIAMSFVRRRRRAR
ncbi:MAG: FG-GAP repeat domain-containing protein, partial [Polyangiaceae bacterium]